MSQSIVAKRYAVALFDLGTEKSALAEIDAELRVIQEVFQENKEVNEFFNNPRISIDQKKQFIRDTFSEVSAETRNLLLLLADKRRINDFTDIVEEFTAMKNEARGIAEADVYSVRELTEDERKNIEEVFTRKLNKNTLRINNIIDPSIIGGLKIRIGNQIYDGTIGTQLSRLEQKLVTANK
ncbi:F0F1 ATP synthase subunit delta [Halalkalibacillus sediminis]|uniref:ATP synthase subunit delta n=1 Tax=Halalkalibacillus sediminis TaxID=2018042 RepID=A0A2I0QTT4_9BACI|nr:F0F1 ATP synthase subunit delta [Halalkalibacillus sediminis]PKR77751.1 F0F1 ATP synthase subunit delta [Halalkalibacillus sediminis]